MTKPAEAVREPVGAPLKSKGRDVVLTAARLLGGGVLLVSILCLFARWSVLAEILTHFRVLYAVAAVGATVLAVLLRTWGLTLLCSLALIWQMAGIVPWYVHAAPTAHAASGTTLTVLTANVSVRNNTKERLLELLAREKPDVVFVQELNRAWAEVLADTYPHKVESDRKDFFGLGFYSRYPVENVEMEDPVGWDVPLMRADIVVDGRRLHVINVHLSPPEGGSLTKIRLVQYPWLTDYVAKVDAPIIVAGDFNCTMWSPLYTDLVKSGKLKNARDGRGIMPSWLPIGGSLFLLPLDHVLARGVDIIDARLTPNIGSDHCPMIAEIRLPPGEG